MKISTMTSDSIRLLSAAAVVFLTMAAVTACSEQGGDRAAEAADADSQAQSAPAWYLAEYPQHPDLRIKKVSQPSAGINLIVYQTAGGKGETLVDWFKTGYSQGGWSIDDEHGDSRFTAEKESGWGANVNVTDTKYATIVSITAYEG